MKLNLPTVMKLFKTGWPVNHRLLNECTFASRDTHHMPRKEKQKERKKET